MEYGWIWMSIKLLLRKSDLQGALLFKRPARRIEMTFNSPDVRNGAICLSGSTALEESSALRLNVVETGLSHLTPSQRLREREREKKVCCEARFYPVFPVWRPRGSLRPRINGWNGNWNNTTFAAHDFRHVCWWLAFRFPVTLLAME